MTELISISKVAIIPVCCIKKLAFVFLASDVAEYTFHVQGDARGIPHLIQILLSNLLIG
jgi:hypothetical protein